jgi:hypothetical protein
MDVNEVPQDEREMNHDAKIKKLMYAVDKDGKYTGVNSVGWEAENLVLKQTWDDIDDALRATEEKVIKGELSPIAYFMQQKLMNTALLARYVGKWQWQVKRHLKPEVFAKLTGTELDKYAGIFNVSTDELKNFGREKQQK